MARKVYTVKEIADAVGRTPPNIRAMFASGKIRGVRVGSGWMASEESLRAWLGDEGYRLFFEQEG